MRRGVCLPRGIVGRQTPPCGQTNMSKNIIFLQLRFREVIIDVISKRQEMYFCTTFILGFIIDYMGRRVTIIINAMLFILGAIVLAVSPNFTTLVRKCSLN